MLSAVWAGASSKSSELLELATFLGAGAGAPLFFEKSSWSGSSLLFQPSEAPRSFFAKTFFDRLIAVVLAQFVILALSQLGSN